MLNVENISKCKELNLRSELEIRDKYQELKHTFIIHNNNKKNNGGVVGHKVNTFEIKSF